MATVNEGRDEIVNLVGAGLTGNRFGSEAIGSGTTAVTDSDTALQTTVDTATGLTASANGNTMTLVGTFTGNSATIREASIYSNTNTVLLARQIVSTINIENSDTLETTWDIRFSDA